MSSEAWWAKLKWDAWKTLAFTLPFSWTLIIANRLCQKVPVIFFFGRTGWVTGTIMSTLVEIRQGLNFTTLSAVIQEQRMLFDALPGWMMMMVWSGEVVHLDWWQRQKEKKEREKLAFVLFSSGPWRIPLLRRIRWEVYTSWCEYLKP